MPKKILGKWLKGFMSFLLLFVFADAMAQSQTFKLVTSNAGLEANAKYVIVGIGSGSRYAMGAQATNNRESVSLSGASGDLSLNVATTSSSTSAFAMTLMGNATTGWYFFDSVNNTYLRPRTGGNNGLQGNATQSGMEWDITVATTGIATVNFKSATGTTTGTYQRGLMRYNPSSAIFACYTSGQNDIYLYKMDVTPVVTSTAATLITANSAQLNGTVNANNISTSLSFNFGTTTSYGTAVSAIPGTESGNTVTAVIGWAGSLSPNTQYHYRLSGTANSTSYNGANQSFYTLANTPNTVGISNITHQGFDVTVNSTTENSNPAVTNYAIQIPGSGYVQANGTVGATAYWATAAAWGTKTVTGLNEQTSYSVTIKARNQSLVETAATAGNSVTTLENQTPRYTVSPATLTFADACINTTSAPQSFNVHGLYLQSIASTGVTIGNITGYQFSVDSNGPFEPNVILYPVAGTIDQLVYVRFAPTTAGSHNANLVVGGAGTQTATVALTATALNTPASVNAVDTHIGVFNIGIQATSTLGCTPITAYGITYSLNENMTSPIEAVVSGNSAGFFAVLNGLNANTTYYVRSYVIDAAGTHYSFVRNFTTFNVGAPVATAATAIADTHFTANWNANGPVSYFLDVSESATFGTTIPVSVTEGFDAGLTAPQGWTYTGMGVYTSTGSAGLAIPSLSFNDTNDEVLTTTYSGSVTSMSFWMKYNGTNFASRFVVEGFNGTTWVELASIAPASVASAGQTFTFNSTSTPALPTGIVKFRFVYTKGSGTNVAFDDYAVTYNGVTPSFVPGYNNLPVTGTSQVVSGLTEGVQYFYRVRAHQGNSTSVNSNTISVTTVALPATFGSIEQVATVCTGEQATFEVNGLFANETSTLTYTIGSGAAQTVNVTANASGEGTFSLTLTSAENGQNLVVSSVARANGNTISTTANNSVVLSVGVPTTFYVDADGDGYGVESSSITSCETSLAGHSLVAGDCDDNVAAINPGRNEVLYNGIDDNCDGNLDEGNQILSQVLPSQCGTTLTALNSLIQAVSKANATGYRFKIQKLVAGTPQGEAVIYERSYPHFTLEMAGLQEYAAVYEISVEVQRNNIWLGYYGPTCQIATPAILDEGGAASVNPTICNSVLPTISTLVYTTSMRGVTGYRFRVTDLNTGSVQVLDRTVHYFALTMLPNYTYGTDYIIEVAVKTTGAYSGFGAACIITSPAVPSLVSCGTTVALPSSYVYTSSMNKATSYRFELTQLDEFGNPSGSTLIDRPLHYFNFSNVPNYVRGAQYSVRVSVMTSGIWSPASEPCIITAPGTARIAADNQKLEAMNVTVFPNPYNEAFNFNFVTSSEEQVTIAIYDMTGRVIENKQLEVKQVEVSNFGQNYPAGVYNVVFTQGADVKTLRVIKR